MDVSAAKERRSQPRVPLAGTAVAFMADQRIDCRSIDVSTSGIALWSPVTRAPGHFLRVNFSLSLPGGIPRWYDADGVVVRVEPRASGVLLGVQFLVIDDRVARDVHAYVMRNLSPATRPTATTRMPDAENPPSSTGEFSPPDTGTHPRRRTSEYGVSIEQGTPPPPVEPSRRPPVIPKTTVAPATPTPTPPTSPAADAAELDRLFREALAQVDAERRRDRRRS
jgi:hypothetical protein